MELEAKWEAARPLMAADLEGCDWAPYTLGERALLEQTNWYFDTAGRALGQTRRTLRLREENGALIVTLKGGGSAVDGVHRREELEVATTSRNPADWAAAIWDEIRGAVGTAPLAVLFRSENQRQAWSVLRDAEIIGELALDTGRVVVGERAAPIHELEWELKHGSPADFTAIAALLSAQLPLTPSDISKFQRGLRLLHPEHPHD